MTVCAVISRLRCMSSTESATFGVRSTSAPMRRVLVRKPAVSGDFTAAQWRSPDPELLADQHARFVEVLVAAGCAVEVAEAADGLVDACYVRDPALVASRGAILFDMGKSSRRREPELLGSWFATNGMPVLGRLSGAAQAEGGDMVWLDEDTLLVGRSYRTNDEGIRQLSGLLAVEGVRVETVDLPHDRGPEHVLHLMSVLSPVAPDLAVVYPPLAPVRLLQLLRDRGVELIEVEDEEYRGMACNVLAVAPREVVMLQGNPRTEAALRAHGCVVHTYDGSEISLKGDGGPTCLTLPLLCG